MNGEFTPKAKAMWDAIPSHYQDMLLRIVWCSHCRRATTITDFKGVVEKGDLILRGRCVICGGSVARLIEGE